MAGKARVLTPKEIESVFRQLATIRNQTLFALGLYTAARIGEIIRLEQSQVFTDEGVRYLLTLERLKKRGTVYSDIPLHPKVRKFLGEYKKVVQQDRFLFPSSQSISGHLSRQQAQEIFEEAFRILKLENGRTHSMRRTSLNTMNQSGVPLRTVQEISGHSNLSELQGYLDVAPEDTHKAIHTLKY